MTILFSELTPNDHDQTIEFRIDENESEIIAADTGIIGSAVTTINITNSKLISICEKILSILR